MRVGHGSTCLAAISIAFSPLSRTIALALLPGGVPRATIVSVAPATLCPTLRPGVTTEPQATRSSYLAPESAPSHSADASIAALAGGELHRKPSTSHDRTCPSDTG